MSVSLFLILLQAADYNIYNGFETFTSMEAQNPTIFTIQSGVEVT